MLRTAALKANKREIPWDNQLPREPSLREPSSGITIAGLIVMARKVGILLNKARNIIGRVAKASTAYQDAGK
jgi:hypothetical protein